MKEDELWELGHKRRSSMRRSIGACLLSVFFMSCLSNSQTKPDIKEYLDAKWGMSKNEIRGIVRLPVDSETDNTLMYKDKIGRDDVGRIYMFDNHDRLLAVMLVFEIVPEEAKLYRSKFVSIFNDLTLKYGVADSYLDEDLTKRGLSAYWNFKSSVILLQLQFKQPFNRLALGLMYLNKAIAKDFLGSRLLDKY